MAQTWPPHLVKYNSPLAKLWLPIEIRAPRGMESGNYYGEVTENLLSCRNLSKNLSYGEFDTMKYVSSFCA